MSTGDVLGCFNRLLAAEAFLSWALHEPCQYLTPVGDFGLTVISTTITKTPVTVYLYT